MGDRTWTGIQFSGVISREVAEGLLEELDAQGCRVDDGPEGNPTIEHLQHQFYDEECNYGMMEGVEEYCRDHHITYLKTWAAGGGYGPGMVIYHAIADTAVACAELDGSPVIGLDELVKSHAAGKIEDMIGFLKSFVDFEANNPPLEVKE